LKIAGVFEFGFSSPTMNLSPLKAEFTPSFEGGGKLTLEGVPLHDEFIPSFEGRSLLTAIEGRGESEFAVIRCYSRRSNSNLSMESMPCWADHCIWPVFTIKAVFRNQINGGTLAPRFFELKKTSSPQRHRGTLTMIGFAFNLQAHVRRWTLTSLRSGLNIANMVKCFKSGHDLL
jgi:hypothetical protein